MTRKIKILILLCCLFPWMQAVADPINTSVGSGSICPDDEVVIPVTVSNCNGVTAISLVLNFDNTKVNYEGYQNVNSAVSSMLVNQSNGNIYMTWANMSAINVGDGTLLELRFTGLSGNSGNANLNWNTTQCEYSDDTGTALQANYYNGSVNVYAVPTITSNPIDHNLAEGQNTYFEVNASGQGLSYQWQIKTLADNSWQDLSNDSHHSNVNNRRLNVNNVALEMNGNQYRCVVSGTCPSPATSGAGTLTVVTFVPTIVTSLGSVAICAEQVFSVPVTVSNCNNVGAISLVLNYNSSLVTYLGYENANAELMNGTMRVNAANGAMYFTWASSNHILHIGDGELISFVFKSASGNSSLTWNTSQCEYIDPEGEVLPTSFSGSNLTIYFPPSITSDPTDKSIMEGQSTDFSINASGQGLSYQWEMSQDQGISWETLSNGGHYSNVTTRTLNVNNVVASMNGYRYRCVVNGTCEPSVTSNHGTLHVEVLVPTIVTTAVSINTCSQIEFGIPISVTNCNNVGAISLALSYNTDVMTYTGYEGVNPELSNGQLQVNAINGMVRIAWASLAGANVSDGNLLTLNFTALSGASDLNWNTTYCEYANLLGEPLQATYNNGNVSVAELSFTITTQPTNQTIIMDENTTFTIETSGTTTGYQWQVSQDQGSSWSNISAGEHYSNPTTNTLSISNVPLEMNGYRYRCAVSGTCGLQYSSVAVLTVQLPPNYYEISLSTDPIEGGTVEGAGAYEEGTSCAVTATPATGYYFVNWTENGTEVSQDSAYTFTVAANRELVANFALQEIDIVTNVVPEGSGTVNGAGSYLYGEHVLLTAIPNTGYVFDSWTENGEVVSSNQSISFTAQADRTLEANFSVLQVNITATPVPASNGSITGAGTFPYGTTVTLVALANEGFQLGSWTENDSIVSTSDTLTFMAETDRNLVANFIIKQVNVTAVADPVGSGTVTGTGTYNYGDPVVLTATPLGQFQFLNWTENGEEVSMEPTISFTAYNHRNLVAHFFTTITIAATTDPEGSGIIQGAGTYNYAEPVTLTALPNTGFSFVNWTENDTLYSTETSINFTAHVNRTFVAHFDSIMHHITVSANNAEAGTVSGGGDYQEGSQATVSAQPNEHYAFVCWKENGVTVSSYANYSFPVWGDRNLVAEFSLSNYEIIATANPENGGTITGAGTYELGETCTLTAIANPSYIFLNWTENGVQVSADPVYSFIITGYRSLVANFVQDQPNTYIISATVQPTGAGTVSGSGGYAVGSTCTLRATPAEGYFFLNWTKNGNVVSTSPIYSFTVTGNANYVAHFSLGLPELHVTGISHSALVAGQQATISWTVQNDGVASTPNGALWHDRVWLSVESRVAAGDNNPILLGTFDNLSALNPGEYYTQTQTFNLPIDIVGEYYLFVLTDAYDCHTIYWDSTGVQLPYNPPPYIGCLSHHCPNCINVADNRIYEQSEYAYGEGPGGYYNDNFFYELIDIEVPILPDLQVTSVIPQTNFFSGSTVNVTATISNLGENTTLTDHWADALFIASEPDFNSSSAVCLAVVAHSGQLGAGQSYQVAFEGTVPLTMYGEAYFFVYTDCYEQVYEHVLNHNNITMSEAVNVILSPPADLEPSDLTVPATVSTGEVFAYSYKVNNIGAGNTNVNNWVDKIYLCQNADTLDTSAVLLKTVNHYGGLQPGANYSVSESLTLPAGINSGTYYLYAFADADNAVFEYLYDGNNLIRSNAINVIQPDLQVTQISAPEQITAGYPLNLSYTLTNAGEGIVRNSMVTDRVYISSSGNMTDTIRIANIRRNVYLAVGQSLTVMCNDLAPYQLTDGTYHLIVLTDCDNEINESNEGNNTLSHYPMSVLHQPLPDMQPVSLTIPDVIQAGENVAVEFDITNIGDMDLLNSNCTFNIYAVWGDQEILCPMQSQTLPLGSTVSIGIGQTVHFARTVLVPPTVTSACSTFELIANKGCLVPELDTTNNVYTATATVLDCPLPDLVITNISATAMQSGVENQVSFIVRNNGTANFEGSFTTTVYVRSALDTILCPLVLQVSPESNSYAIPTGGTLSLTQNVLVPPMANASCNILEVVVDEENLVLESNDDNNATTVAATVLNYPFDLKTMALQVTESVWAGETTSLTWTVKNIGTCPSDEIPLYVKKNGTYTLVQGELLPQSWVDKVFVSTDAVLSDDDIELCSVARSTVVQPNGTYMVEQSVTLPYTHLGAQYLLCVSDATRVTYDSDTLNNVKSVPIDVQLGSLPDLRITSLTVEEELTCDRAYWVHYTVVNEGERVTQKENWTDALFIGEAMTHIGAFQLSSKIHHGALEVGESYTDSIEILIPNGLVGDYFLIGFTDRTNQVYEHNNEDDNILALPVTVQASDPCDLIAVQPEFPTSVFSGHEMTVSWQLRNNGMNPAMGRVRNAVYLSTDAAWSSDDKMLGYADIDINIAASNQVACSLSGFLTGIAEGNYYVIVKANILNALNESSYENNVCVSLLTTEVNFPILEIGESRSWMLGSREYAYYKIQVGSEYEGQTLLCHFESPDLSISVDNGIYLSHESVPTPADFDYGAFTPYLHDLEIVVPSLEQGSYYMLVEGEAIYLVGESKNLIGFQYVSVSTSILNFEILGIDADHGANTGSVTTKVTGAKFDSIMDFRLVQGGNYLPAEKVFFSNSTETYTTFDLAEMPLGVYAMEAELPGGIITIKGDAFTIEEGLPAELAINIVAPASVRSGNTFAVNIEYGNTGTTDLNVSGFVVVSRNGHPIGFSTEELLEGQTELTFYTAESNSNPDVLRPGYLGTKAIMVKATPSTDVSLAVFAIRRQY